MKIAIDLDGVLANIHDEFIAAAYRLGFKDKFVQDSPPDAFCLFSPQERKQIWEAVLAVKNIYQSMSIYANAVVSLREFLDHQNMREFAIYYMTRRRQDAGDGVMHQTAIWLHSFGLSNLSTSIIVLPPHYSRTKLELCDELGIDYLLDDSIKNLWTSRAAHEEGFKTKGYLLMRPWNMEHLNDFAFVASMDQFLGVVMASHKLENNGG